MVSPSGGGRGSGKGSALRRLERLLLTLATFALFFIHPHSLYHLFFGFYCLAYITCYVHIGFPSVLVLSRLLTVSCSQWRPILLQTGLRRGTYRSAIRSIVSMLLMPCTVLLHRLKLLPRIFRMISSMNPSHPHALIC
jgi:hypothetical protein